MVETRVFTKSEYVNLIPRVSTSDYESLKQSIKEHGGLLMPIILNQDKVVLDGHNRLRACIELGLPVSHSIKDFTGRPLDELKYVVTVNLHRRHLDEFQRAEVAIKFDKLYRKIARERYEATLFSSEAAREAARKKHEKDTEDFSSSLRHRGLRERRKGYSSCCYTLMTTSYIILGRKSFQTSGSSQMR